MTLLPCTSKFGLAWLWFAFCVGLEVAIHEALGIQKIGEQILSAENSYAVDCFLYRLCNRGRNCNSYHQFTAKGVKKWISSIQ